MNIITFFRNKYYRNKEMVSYWKTQNEVEAKVYKHEDGHYEMQMKGEKYPFPGFPRGILMYGGLSFLKHNVKNKIFNDIWKDLEEKTSGKEIISRLKTKILPEIFEIAEKTKYDMVPYERMISPVKEIWRAMTKIEDGNKKVRALKEIICFILQEDDAYRMRLQWIVKFFPKWWKPNIRHFEYGLSMLEHAEIVGDMKERQRLFKRVLMFIIEDETIRPRFERLLKEIDWKKLKMTKADKYFFRAKWFKVDYPEYSY